jgi:hypothetical protein
VVGYLRDQWERGLAQVDRQAFSAIPLPSYQTTQDMVCSIIDFDPQCYWEQMLADHWAEHQCPDLPAYVWLIEDRPGFRDYLRELRPFNAKLLLQVAAARFDESGPWFAALAARADAFAAWCAGDACSVWSGDYDLACIVKSFAYFLDLCGERMDDAVRRRFLDGLQAFAGKLRQVIEVFQPHRFPLDSHVFQLTVMYAQFCLVLHHHGRAAGAEGLKFWTEQMMSRLPGFGGDDGGWAMGTAYWKWKLIDLVNITGPMRSLGLADMTELAFLQNTGYFKWYCQPPYARCGGFGDHPNLRAGPLDLAIMRTLGGLLGKAELVAYADEFQPPIGFECEGVSNPAEDTEALLMLLNTWNLPVAARAQTAPDAPARWFRDVGVTACHSAIGDARNDVFVLFRSSPFGSLGHAHADQNAFVVEAFGQPIFINAGYYPSYHHPQMKGYAIQTMAHNALLLNNQGQAIRNFNAKGVIEHFESGRDHDYMIGECAAAYPSSPKLVRRHLWFDRTAGRPWLLIVDHVLLKQPGNIDFLLHSYEEPRWDPQRREAEFAGWRLWGTDARALVQFLTPGNWYWRQTNEFPYPADGREENRPKQWHACATTAAPVYEHWLVTAITFGRRGVPGLISSSAPNQACPRVVCAPTPKGWLVSCGESALHVSTNEDRILRA